MSALFLRLFWRMSFARYSSTNRWSASAAEHGNTQGSRVAQGGTHDTVIKKVCAAIEQAGQLSRQGSKGLYTEQYEGSPQCSIEVGNN